MINGISLVIGESTLLQYTTFYDKSYTNAFTTGQGFGSLIGAAWAVTAQKISLRFSIMCVIVFPGLLGLLWFIILSHPKPSLPRLSSLTINYVDDIDFTAHEAGTQNNIVMNLSQTGSGATIEEPTEKTQSRTYVGAIPSLKIVFIDLWQYSWPLFATYFIFEMVRSGWFGSLFKAYKQVYPIFNWCFRSGSFIGKAFIHLVSIKQLSKLWLFPTFVGSFGIFVVAIKIFYTTTPLSYFVESNGGHYFMYFLGIPVGISYGSISAKVFHSIRQNVADKQDQEFALSNVKQGSTLGQLVGTLIVFLLKWLNLM
jgi:hypothetical protein